MFKVTWTAVTLPLNLLTMARCATGQNQFQGRNEVIRRGDAATIAALAGQRITRLVSHYDLVGTWEGADPTRAYAGLVPEIGGIERLDLALLTRDLLIENIPTFPNGADGAVVFVTPQDDLHAEARRLAAGNVTYEAWFNALVATFPTGLTIEPFAYAARTRSGGIWRNFILGGRR